MYLEKFNPQSKFDLEINRDHTLSRATVYFIKQEWKILYMIPLSHYVKVYWVC